MKKVFLSITSVALFCGAMIFSGCSTDDVTMPVITLKGNATDVVIYKIAATYTDPGAEAKDETDGEVKITVTGTVDMNSAGEYTLTYTATDAAGNTATKERKVTVDAAPYLAATYGHTDNIDGTAYPEETEIITTSSTKNKILFVKFAGYTGAAPYATLSGDKLTIPPQTFTCGQQPQKSLTFQSTTDAAFNGTGWTVFFKITDVSSFVTGSSVYIKK